MCIYWDQGNYLVKSFTACAVNDKTLSTDCENQEGTTALQIYCLQKEKQMIKAYP